MPNPLDSDVQAARFFNQDIDGLSPDVAWAEREKLARWLSHVMFTRQRPKMIFATGPGEFVTDQDWARQRIARLTGKRAA